MTNDSYLTGDAQILMTAQEAADYLRIPIGSLYVRISKKQIPCAKLGRLLRFKKPDLDRLLEAQYSGAGPTADEIPDQQAS